DGNGEGEDSPIIDGQQRVGDALARRQLSTQVLLDEVRKCDDDFCRQHGNDEHRPEAFKFEQAKREEEHGVGEVARAVKFELAALRDSPRQALHHFVVVDDVEQTERELNSDQGPKERGGHGAISRNMAIWRRSRPKRGWKICSVKLNFPSGSSAWVT